MTSLSGRKVNTRNSIKNLNDLGFNLPSETFSSLSSYFNIESGNIIFSSALTNKYKLLKISNRLKERNKMIKEFKDELKSLKIILNEIKKLELLREQEMNKIRNDTKRKLNMLDDEISDISDTLDVNLMTLVLRCKFFLNFEI